MSTRPGNKRKASRRSRQSAAAVRAAQLPSRGWLGFLNQLVLWRLSPTRPAWLWPYGALAAILGLVLWPAWSNPGKLMVGGDVLVYFYPLQVLLRDSLAAGDIPFWNPYSLSGAPALANPQAGYLYPPHWALLWAPATLALNLSMGLHVIVAGLGAAWCAGRLGASKDGQLLSGVAFGLGSAMTARLMAGHLNWLEANAWLPFATGLAIQIRRPRSIALLALVIGLIVLAGRPEIIIFSLWWLPLWAGVAAFRDGWRSVLTALVSVGLGVSLGVGLGAIQALPSLGLISVSNRQAGVSWEFLTLASLPPWHLLGALAPSALGDPPHQNYWAGMWFEWHERLLYVGVVPLLAALRAGGRWRWVCLGVAALAVALSFGRYVPWYAWAEAVLPGYQNFRVPSKHLTLAALALALGAGLGIERLHGRRVAIVVGGGALVAVIASLSVAQWLPLAVGLLGGSETPIPTSPDALAAPGAPALRVTALLLALVAAAALLPSRWSVRAQLILATLELAFVLGPYRASPADPQAIAAQLAPMRGHSRAALIGPQSEIAAQYGPILRVTQPAGYEPLVSNAYATLVTGLDEPNSVVVRTLRADDPALSLLGVETVFESGKPPAPLSEPPRPAAWVARCAWPGSALQVRAPDFPRDACITRAAATERDQPVPVGTSTVLETRSGWLLARAEGPGWLVTTLPWYPGWSARVDDTPVDVEAVDGALVGVPLSPGTHTVALSYRPAWLEAGVALTLVAVLVLLGWLVWERRREERLRGIQGLPS